MATWGEHIGFLFADKRYETECELSRRFNNARDAERARYIYRFSGLERFDPNSGGADAWIPVGVFWDLLDDNTHNLAPLFVLDPVVDNMQGINHQIMFNAITQNAPTEIITVRDAIKANSPTNATQIDALFWEYGY